MKPFLEFMNEDTERLRIGDLVKVEFGKDFTRLYENN